MGTPRRVAAMNAYDSIERGAADECEPLTGRRPRTFTLTQLLVACGAVCVCAVGATTVVNTHRASEGALPDHADHVGAHWGSNYSIETMLDMHERMHERMHEQLTTCENKLAEREAELKAAAQTEAAAVKKAIDATAANLRDMEGMAESAVKRANLEQAGIQIKAAAQTEADDLKKAIDATKKTAAN